MIDGLFASTNYQGVKKMLDATVLRHEAISSNLANIETPHYKRIDLNPSFASDLSGAINSQSRSGVENLRPSVGVDFKAVAQNADGNTVQLEGEMLHMQDNTLAHQMQTQLITGALQKLRYAISARGI
ncbi:MAG: flagellar basal body rod protein FlgB [Pedosphaera sp.]|nr:flagellar basal body rod protein FlgB [Pedosphaera sp.]MSS99823.1 flagellar basal body rod protein FlgB [Pedosphaera sp.]